MDSLVWLEGENCQYGRALQLYVDKEPVLVLGSEYHGHNWLLLCTLDRAGTDHNERRFAMGRYVTRKVRRFDRMGRWPDDWQGRPAHWPPLYGPRYRVVGASKYQMERNAVVLYGNSSHHWLAANIAHAKEWSAHNSALLDGRPLRIEDSIADARYDVSVVDEAEVVF